MLSAAGKSQSIHVALRVDMSFMHARTKSTRSRMLSLRARQMSESKPRRFASGRAAANLRDPELQA
jgi:hypothetical protein